ncbi:MAG: transporter, partial [Parvibaculaceae bacterium]
QVHAGVAGYYYQQLTGDSGSGATLGDFESRVLGIGPQIGYFVPAGEMQAYVNVKGFYEFDAQNRPEGWSAWLTIALTPKAGE